jgi:ATP-binding cassette subfamily C exporter for protease/lipase
VKDEGVRMNSRKSGKGNRFDEVMRAVRTQMPSVFLFSLFANLLVLTLPIYMLQIYDRVLSSGSVDTLIWLSLLAGAALVVYGVMEQVRKRVLTRVGAWIDRELSPEVIRRGIRAKLSGTRSEASFEDVLDVRAFYAGEALLAFLDAPWIPLFIALIWMLHPVLGIIAIIAAILLFGIAVLNDWLTRRHQSGLNDQSRQSGHAAAHYLESAETISPLGMTGSLIEQWRKGREPLIDSAVSLTDMNSRFSNLSRTARIGFQVAVLGVGAALIMRSELTPGGMISASIIMSRALSPVERSITAWRSYTSYRIARRRLVGLFRSQPDQDESFDLPRPKGHVVADSVQFMPEGSTVPILKRVSFTLNPGEVCGIIGPSGSGKSTLCKLAVGAWKPDFGTIRIDGADVATWDPEKLGPHVGYLPQEVELFPGTIAENIARMRPSTEDEIVDAARLAGAHEMILKMPDGYDSQVGPRGTFLSGGQRQRVGVARAFFGNPAFLVLDEPNANLDGDGELALMKAVAEFKRRGCTMLLVAHQPGLMRVADKVMVLKDGIVAKLGPRDEILKSLMKTMPKVPASDAPVLGQGANVVTSFPGAKPGE